jgi:hypothetical protein
MQESENKRCVQGGEEIGGRGNVEGMAQNMGCRIE